MTGVIKKSFMKGKTGRKGSPKQKLGADIIQMLDNLKESENDNFEGYGENHNWTYKSCLWKLTYAKELLVLHNIDLMHQERNIVESIISTCLDVTGFFKDNMNARKDLAILYDRPLLEVKKTTRGNLTRPRATYCLMPTKRKEILKWLKKLKFSDRYAANIKRAVNVINFYRQLCAKLPIDDDVEVREGNPDTCM
jgi:hypothetical protein